MTTCMVQVASNDTELFRLFRLITRADQRRLQAQEWLR